MISQYRIDPTLKPDYKDKRKDHLKAKMPEVKVLLLSMSIEKVAKRLKISRTQLSKSMAEHGVSAIRERYINKLKLSKQ